MNDAPFPKSCPSDASGAVPSGTSPNPKESFEETAFQLYAYEFSWDIEKSLQFALFRTYAVPEISRLLATTGEFETRPRKRYDDTELILAEIIEHGLDSPRGVRSIARMNAMHARFRIRDDDMLYVLSTFICEPIRWLDQFGRRPMTETERRAWFKYYRGLGARMGIRDLPDDLADLMRWNESYERERFRFAETNNRIATATRDLFLSFYLPRWLNSAGRPVVNAVLDTSLLESMGFAAPPQWLRHAVFAGLRLRARALRWLPRHHRPRRLTQLPRPTYPEGYRIEELGTFAKAKGTCER
ncbi:MAG: oxygenase MpaB family protein [Pseudomonadota bacterium]